MSGFNFDSHKLIAFACKFCDLSMGLLQLLITCHLDLERGKEGEGERGGEREIKILSKIIFLP